MRLLLMPAALLLVFMTSNSALAVPGIRVVDDAGAALELEHPAQRVITLAPHLTEILFAINAGQQVVGTVRHSDFPEAAKKLPVVGDAAGISFESVIALRPDLVVNWRSGISPAITERLSSMGFPIYQSEPAGLAGVAENIRELGLLAGHADRGEELAGRFLEQLETLRALRSRVPEVAVFYQVWDAPLMTIGSGQMIDEVIRLCGGRNIFSDLSIPVPQVGFETVLGRDPEVILYGQPPGDISRAWISRWQQFTPIAAVRNRHLYAINADLISRPGPRLIDGIREICAVLDRVRNANE